MIIIFRLVFNPTTWNVSMPFMTWDQPWPSRSPCLMRYVQSSTHPWWPFLANQTSNSEPNFFRTICWGGKKKHQTVLAGSSCNDSDSPTVWSQYRHSLKYVRWKNEMEMNGTQKPQNILSEFDRTLIFMHAFLKPQMSHAPYIWWDHLVRTKGGNFKGLIKQQRLDVYI